MMRKSTMYIMILSGVLLATCSNDFFPERGFQYTAYDSAGVKIVKGWFTLIRQDSTTFKGTWNFRKIGEPQDIGPQVGEGMLTGHVHDGDRIIIELNPEMVDNNVTLDGSYSRNDIVGTWSWSTIAGLTNQGTFRAIK
jgi:hypothetical protein